MVLTHYLMFLAFSLVVPVKSFLPDCPRGYTLKKGDIVGWGSLEEHLHVDVRDDCARICNLRPDCLSFEHSNKEKICNLNREQNPTEHIYKDYAFCSKTDSLNLHCPHGYTRNCGDIPGWGSIKGKIPMANREDCAKLCDSTEHCWSFEHSNKGKLCNLNKETNPTHGRFKDYTFCSKFRVAYYGVTSVGDGLSHHSSLMGHYTPTGDTMHGFPVYHHGGHYMYVEKTGSWIIGDTLGHSSGRIYSQANHPTPHQPPTRGWSFTKTRSGRGLGDDDLTVVGVGQPIPSHRVSRKGGWSRC